MKEVFNPIAESKAAKEFGKKIQPKPKEEKPVEPREAEPTERRDFINKYGFLHVDRKLAERLGIKLGKGEKNVPVIVEVIEGGFIVKLKV